MTDSHYVTSANQTWRISFARWWTACALNGVLWGVAIDEQPRSLIGAVVSSSMLGALLWDRIGDDE